jgi:hypothetical protein
MPLGAGDWLVLATGVLRNTTRDAVAHAVVCRLRVGSSADQILASPRRRGGGGSRHSFLLLHAAHLERDGRATLRCAAPGSSRGAVVVEHLRMTALKTAALGITHELGSEIFHGNADAASQARLLIGNDALVPFALRTVATASLPAGRWAMTAKATVLHASDTLGELRCFLEVTVADAGVAAVAAVDTPGDRLPVALDGLQSSSGPSAVPLRCQDLSDGGTTGIRDIRIAAYRATAIDSRELDPDASFPATPAGIRQVVYVAHETENRTIPVSTSFRAMNGLSLPAGSWLVVATGVIPHAGGGTADVTCRVGRRSFDEVSLRLGAADTMAQQQPFALTWAGSLTARNTVRFQCHASAANVSVYYLSFTIYRIGSLRSVPLS